MDNCGYHCIKQTLRWILPAVFISLFASSIRAEGLIQAELRIPATFSKSGNQTLQLEAFVVRPDDQQPHPLVIINHGSPRKPAERKTVSPHKFIPQAIEFARRGWTAVIVIRRGYGESEGAFAESYGKCNDSDYTAAGQQTAEDIRQAMAWLAKQPYVRPDAIMSVGVSAGGFGTVALTTDPPPGLVAAINFAGGRGSLSQDEVCSETNLVEAFRSYGERSRVPMLWVYSDNDHFFGPKLARKLHATFTAGGGRASLIQAPAFDDDGHHLFSRSKGIPVWTPYIDDFLKKQGLMRREPLISAGTSHALRPPKGLSSPGLAAFKEYLTAPAHKAFAVSNNDSGYGWRSGRRTLEEAESEAIANCEKHGHDRECEVYMADDKLSE